MRLSDLFKEGFFQKWAERNKKIKESLKGELRSKELHYLISQAELVNQEIIFDLEKAISADTDSNLFKISKDTYDEYYTTLPPQEFIEPILTKERKNHLQDLLDQDFTEINKDSYFYLVLTGAQLGKIDQEIHDKLYRVCFCSCKYLSDENANEAIKKELNLLADIFKNPQLLRRSKNLTKRNGPINFEVNEELLLGILKNNLKYYTLNDHKKILEKNEIINNIFKGKFFKPENLINKEITKSFFNKLKEKQQLKEFFLLYGNYSENKPEEIKNIGLDEKNFSLSNETIRITIGVDNFHVKDEGNREVIRYTSNKECIEDNQKSLKDKFSFISSIVQPLQVHQNQYTETISNQKVMEIPFGYNEAFTVLKTAFFNRSKDQEKNNPKDGNGTAIHTDDNNGFPFSLLLRVLLKENDSYQNHFIIPALKVIFKNKKGLLLFMLSNIAHTGEMRPVEQMVNETWTKTSSEKLEKKFREIGLDENDINILIENLEFIPSVLVTAIYSSSDKTPEKIHEIPDDLAEPELPLDGKYVDLFKLPPNIQNWISNRVDCGLYKNKININCDNIRIALNGVAEIPIPKDIQNSSEREWYKIVSRYKKIYFILKSIYLSFKEDMKSSKSITVNEKSGYGLFLDYCHQLCSEFNQQLMNLGWPITFNLKPFIKNGITDRDKARKFIKENYFHLLECFYYLGKQLELATRENENILKIVLKLNQKEINSEKILKENIKNEPERDKKLDVKKTYINIRGTAEQAISLYIKKSNKENQEKINKAFQNLEDIKSSVEKDSPSPLSDVEKADYYYYLGTCLFYIATHMVANRSYDVDKDDISRYCKDSIDYFSQAKSYYEKFINLTMHRDNAILVQFDMGCLYEILGDYYFDIAYKKKLSCEEKIERIKKSKENYSKARDHYSNCKLRISKIQNKIRRQAAKDYVLINKITPTDPENETPEEDIDSDLEEKYPHRADEENEENKNNFIELKLQQIKLSINLCKSTINQCQRNNNIEEDEFSDDDSVMKSDEKSKSELSSESDSELNLKSSPKPKSKAVKKRTSKSAIEITTKNHQTRKIPKFCYTTKSVNEQFVKKIQVGDVNTWKALFPAFCRVIDDNDSASLFELYRKTMANYCEDKKVTFSREYKPPYSYAFGHKQINDYFAVFIRNKLSQEIHRQDNVLHFSSKAAKNQLKNMYYEFLNNKQFLTESFEAAIKWYEEEKKKRKSNSLTLFDGPISPKKKKEETTESDDEMDEFEKQDQMEISESSSSQIQINMELEITEKNEIFNHEPTNPEEKKETLTSNENEVQKNQLSAISILNNNPWIPLKNSVVILFERCKDLQKLLVTSNAKIKNYRDFLNEINFPFILVATEYHFFDKIIKTYYPNGGDIEEYENYTDQLNEDKKQLVSFQIYFLTYENENKLNGTLYQYTKDENEISLNKEEVSYENYEWLFKEQYNLSSYKKLYENILDGLKLLLSRIQEINSQLNHQWGLELNLLSDELCRFLRGNQSPKDDEYKKQFDEEFLTIGDLIEKQYQNIKNAHLSNGTQFFKETAFSCQEQLELESDNAIESESDDVKPIEEDSDNNYDDKSYNSDDEDHLPSTPKIR